jgi:hypothetical protein
VKREGGDRREAVADAGWMQLKAEAINLVKETL